jgi:hypothetical protein
MWAIMAAAVDPRGNREWAPYVIGPIVGALQAAVIYTAIVLKTAGADRATPDRHVDVSNVLAA